MALQTFLKIDGIDGNATQKGFENWFELHDYDFEVDQLVSQIQYTTSGGGSRLRFEPLYVEIDRDQSGIGNILGALIGNDLISSVQLHVVDDTITSGDQAITELTLNGSRITGYGEGDGLNSRLAFDFQKIELTNYDLKVDGGGITRTDEELFEVDLLPAGYYVGAPAQSRLDGGAEAGSGTEIFIDFEGIKGGSTDSKHADEFNVLSYEFDFISYDENAENVSGPPSFATSLTPLIIEVATNQVGINELMARAANGDLIGTKSSPINDVVLTIRKSSSGNEFQTISLERVDILKAQQLDNSNLRLSLAYDQIEIKIADEDDLGKLGTPSVFELDLVKTNTEIDRSDFGTMPLERGPDLVDAFLKIDGIDGFSTDVDHKDQFDVLNFDYGYVFDSGKGGSTLIEPLVVDINPYQPGGAQIIGALVNGTVISDVTLSVRKTGGTNDFQVITLTNAKVASFNQAPGMAARLGFTFDKMKVANDIDGEGPLTTLVDFTIDAVKVPTWQFNVGGELQPEAPLDLGGVAAYLDVAKVTGDSTSNVFGALDAFNVSSYDFDFETGATFNANPNSPQSGDRSLTPLTVTLAPEALGLVHLTEHAVTQSKISDVDLYLAKNTINGEVAFTTINLTDAYIVGYNEQADGQVEVQFSYAKIDGEFGEFDGSGKLTNQQNFSFDAASLPSTAPAFFVNLEAEVLAADPVNSDIDYFLKVGSAAGKDEIKGNSLDANHIDQFDVVGYQFDIENQARPLIGSAEPAKAFALEFSPLYVDVVQGQTGNALLLSNLVNQISISEIVLASALDVGAATNIDFEKITLTDATILTYQEQLNGATRIAFDYDEVKVERFEIDGNGNKAGSDSFESELPNGVSSAGENNFEGVETSTSNQFTPLEFNVDAFLKIGDIKGPSVDAKHKDFFDVFDYSFDLTSLAGAQTSSGSVAPGPVNVTVNSHLPGIAKLLETASEDTAIPEAKLVLRTDPSGLNIDFQTVTLNNVRLINHSDNGDGTTDLSFGYSQLQFDIKDIDQTGKVQSPVQPIDLKLDDNVQGTSSGEELNGGGGNDTLYAFGGDDTVNGGTGNDLLIGGSGAGNDQYDGGPDNDTISYSSTTLGITVDLSAAMDHASGPEIDTDQISNVENVIGGSGNDVITGDANDNVLKGGGGNDVINGGDGGDTLFGEDGTDTLNGGADADRLVAGAGPLNAFQNLNGFAGDDTYEIARDSGRVFIGAGAEGVDPGNVNGDVLFMPELDLADVTVGLFDYTTSSPIHGMALNLIWDTFSEVRAANRAEHFEWFVFQDTALSNIEVDGSGNPVLTGLDTEDDTIQAGDQHDTIRGLGGVDTLLGGGGNDDLDPGAGTITAFQTVGGQAGDDTYRFGSDNGRVFIGGTVETASQGTDDRIIFTDLGLQDFTVDFFQYTGAAGTAHGRALSFLDLNRQATFEMRVALDGQNIESFEFADGATVEKILAASDAGGTTMGTAADEYLAGQDGADVLLAGGGNDILHGGKGEVTFFQTLAGQDGDDTYVYGQESSRVFIGGNTASGESATSGTNDRFLFADMNVEDVVIDFVNYPVVHGKAISILDAGRTYSNEVRIALEGQHIESFVFADGLSFSSVLLADDAGGTTTGTAADEYLAGQDGADVLLAGGGNDILHGGKGEVTFFQTLAGQDGDDTYVYGQESSRVFIGGNTASGESTTSGTNDRFLFADMNVEDVVIDFVNYPVVHGKAISILDAGRTYSNEVRIALEGQHIESFVFADGLSFSSVLLADDAGGTTTGTAADEYLAGQDAEFEQLLAGGGNDVLHAGKGGVGNFGTLAGQEGDDTYVYAKESGRIFIGGNTASGESATSGTNDRFVFADLNFADFTVNYVNYGAGSVHGNALSLIWTEGATFGEVRVANQGMHIESYEFADGQVMTWDEFIV